MIKLFALCIGTAVFAQEILQNLPEPDNVTLTEEPSRCEASKALLQILSELQTAFKQPMRSDAAPSIEQVNNVLDVVRRYLQQTPNTFHNTEMHDKFKDLEDQLQSSLNAGRNEKGLLARSVRESGDAAQHEASCREAYAKLMHIAYMAYLQLASHPMCAAAGHRPPVPLPGNALKGQLGEKPSNVAYMPPTGSFGVPPDDAQAQHLALLNLPASSNNMLTDIHIPWEPALSGPGSLEQSKPEASVPVIQTNLNNAYLSGISAQSLLNHSSNNILNENRAASKPISGELLEKLHATNLALNQKNNFNNPISTANAMTNDVSTSYVIPNNHNLLSNRPTNNYQNVASFAYSNPNGVEQVIYEKRLIKTLGGPNSSPGAMTNFRVVGQNPLLTPNVVGNNAQNRPNTSYHVKPLHLNYNDVYYQLPTRIINNDLKGPQPTNNQLHHQQQYLPKTALFANSVHNIETPQQTVFNLKPYLSTFSNNNLLNMGNQYLNGYGNPQYGAPNYPLPHSDQYETIQRLRPQVLNQPQSAAFLNPQQQYVKQPPPRVTETSGQKGLQHPQISEMFTSYLNQQQILSNAVNSDLYNVNQPNSMVWANSADPLGWPGASTAYNWSPVGAGPDVVELTYMLKSPQVYKPYYIVKYKMPYAAFVTSLNELLMKKPNLRAHPDKLYYQLLHKSNISGVSRALKDYDSDDIHKLVHRDGAFVNAQILNKNDTALNEQLRIVQGLNSNLPTNDILKTLDNLSEVTNKSSDIGSLYRDPKGPPIARVENVNTTVVDGGIGNNATHVRSASHAGQYRGPGDGPLPSHQHPPYNTAAASGLLSYKPGTSPQTRPAYQAGHVDTV